jgi:LuxR family quorum sensing-dependent transcriptional regulator
VLRDVLDMAEEALAAADAASAGDAFHRGIARHGASYLQLRRYRRPRGRLTSQSHWQAGGVVARYCPAGWEASSGFHYVCFENNPLLGALADGATRFRFRDYAPDGDRRYAPYWDALAAGGMAEAVGAHGFGPNGAVASVHLGFASRDVDADLLGAAHAAASLVAERLLRFDHEAAPDALPLTPRERDALSYVAEGKTDWEIAVILGVSEATARFHVDNARRKLGAVNRAHAVARFLAASFL